MDSIQEKAQRDQAKSIRSCLEAAVEGLAPGSPEREAAFKKALDNIARAVPKEKKHRTIWDFSFEKALSIFIRDELIILRPVKTDDADFYVNVKAQYSMMYRGILHMEKHRSDSLLLVDLCQPESFYCMIEEATERSPIGYIGIKDTGTEPWEIAIELDKEHTHKGFGSRSIRLFLNEIQRITGKAKYRALVETDNRASQKCFKKLGACLVGLCNGPILKLDEEKRRFEDLNLRLIDDNMREVAACLGVEPRKLLSHVLEYHIACPL